MTSILDFTGKKLALLKAIFVFAVIGACLASLWIHSGKTQHYLCEVDCGETALAQNAVNGFRDYGFKFGLLENLGSAGDPYIYTHNVNLGGLFFVFLDTIGVREFESKQIAVLGVFGLSLLYAFLLVQFVGRSFLPAAIMLVLMASTYWVVTAFALNALRAWHFVALLGVAYHLMHCLKTERLPFPKVHVLGFAFASCVAFGCGYDFWVICGALALTLTAFQVIQYRNRRVQAWCVILIIACFTLPFILRQFQVVGAMGVDYWKKDVVYSIGIKVPGAAKLTRLPPLPEIDACYKAHHVMRPPAVPSNSFPQIFNTLKAMVEAVTLPRWGLATLLILVSALGYGVFALVTRKPARDPRESSPANLITELLVPMMIAISAGLLIFAPFSLHVYVKHEFPLIAAPVLLAKAIAICWLVRVYRASSRFFAKAIAVAAGLLLVVDAAILHHRANNNGIAVNLRWVPFVSSHLDTNLLFSTYYVSIKGMEPGKYRYAPPLDRKAAGELLRATLGLDPGADKDLLRYDYWIHQPLDRYYFMDASTPSCGWSDWLSSALLVPLSVLKARVEQSWIDDPRVGPGSVVFFGGNVPRTHRAAKLAIEVQGAQDSKRRGGAVSSLEVRYNCIYRTFIGRIDLGSRRTGDMDFDLVSILPSGKRDVLHRYTISVDARARKADRSAAFVPPSPPQILPSELASLLPPEAVAERSDHGIGYLGVDLRKLREMKWVPGAEWGI